MKKQTKTIMWVIAAVLVLGLIISGGLFIKNRRNIETFGQEYNAMNADYKNVLFASGQDKPETAELMKKYQTSFKIFYNSYSEKPIKPYNTDAEWKQSLDKINNLLVSSSTLIAQNKSKDAHLELEKVRQTWQETLKRNNVTMLGFYLTEFHDIMEKAIEESEKKDFEKLDVICIDINNSWTEVVSTQTEFSTNQDYKDKIASETATVNEFCDAVKNRQDDVLDLSAKLKSGFIPFYLKYG